jgi:signal peptidase I
VRTIAHVLLWLALIGGAVAGVLRATCLRLWTMPGDDALLALSVIPTAEAGDVLILLRAGTPGFGDLVRCTDPEVAGKYVVGRILGEEGDRITMDHAAVTVNDKIIGSLRACMQAEWVVPDPTTGESFGLSCDIEEAGGSEYTRVRASRQMDQALPYRVTVPRSQIFIASDNRYYHDDSRDFGTLAKESCRERIVFRLWSARGWFDETRRLVVIR